MLWNVAHGASWGENGVVVLAVSLRMLTTAMALASVQPRGARVPSWILLAGLWGAAAVQPMYPLTETVVKALILTRVMAPVHKGISNMSPEGWFNFGATWVVWGIPGILFLLAALSTVRGRPYAVGGCCSESSAEPSFSGDLACSSAEADGRPGDSTPVKERCRLPLAASQPPGPMAA